jgi:hypothetical protein
MGRQQPDEDLSLAMPDESPGAGSDLSLTLPSDPPDVYFLVFDRFPSASVLRDYFDYDNDAFVAALRDLGFQVCDSAMANYPMTHISLACTLGLDYLGDQYLGQTPYRPMIQRSRVALALQEVGYRYVHVGSWYEPTRRNPIADENLNYSLLLSEFSKALLRTTPYHLFLLRDEMYRQALYALWKLERLPRTPGPKFVFAHLLIPHPPYVVDADGSALQSEEFWSRTEEENYLNQIRFLESRLPRLMRSLITESERPPVILLQSDEGTLIFGRQKELGETEKRRIRAGILLASYFPGLESPGSALCTPVNSFRVVFNRYFGTDLVLHEDRIFYWPEVLPNGHPLRKDQPFPFIEITDDLGGCPLHPGASRN